MFSTNHMMNVLREDMIRSWKKVRPKTIKNSKKYNCLWGANVEFLYKILIRSDAD
jgi:hypothetical protein